MSIAITRLTRDRNAEAIDLLARAFVTNPLHVAVFGPGQIAANRAFFTIAIAVMKGPIVVAVDGKALVGLIHWIDSGQCQLSPARKLVNLPAMFGGLGLRGATSVARWLSIWSRYDPSEHHVHLGPVGVSPDAQGRGIGRRLMEQYCDTIDASGEVGYLETDRPENIAFYSKFGFEVTGTAVVEGITNYFMRRSRQLRPTSRPDRLPPGADGVRTALPE